MACTYEYNGSQYTKTQLLSLIKEGKIAYKTINQLEARKWLKENLNMTDDEILTTRDLIANNAFGRFLSDGKILLSDRAIYGTEFHEAFHRVFRAYLTQEERDKLINSLPDSVAEMMREDYPDLSLYRLKEEYLANEFRTYMLNGKTKFTIFEQLLNFIKKLVGLKTRQEILFDKIKAGGFKKAKLKEPRIYEEADSIQVGKERLSFIELNSVIDSLAAHVVSDTIQSGNLYSLTKGKVDISTALNLAYNKTNAEMMSYLKSTYPDEVEAYEKLKLTGEKDVNKFKEIAPNFVAGLIRAKNLVDDYKSQNSVLRQELQKKLATVKLKLTSKASKEAKEAALNQVEKETIEDSIDDLEISNEAQGVGAYYDKASFEFDPNASMSAELRLMFLGIKDTKQSDFGLTKSIDFIGFANYLNVMLSGVPATDETMMKKLVSLQNSPKWETAVKELINLLGGVTRTTLDKNDHDLLRIQFIQKFAQSRYDFLTTIFNNGSYYTSTVIEKQSKDSIRRSLNNNLQLRILESGGFEDWFTQLSAAETFEDKLYLLGLEEFIGDEDLETKINNIIYKSFITKKVDLLKNINSIYTARVKAIGPITKSKDPYENKQIDINGILDKLANIKYDNGDLVELSVFNTEGKKVYTVSLNTYTTQVIDALNYWTAEYRKEGLTGKELRAAVMKEIPQLNNVYTQDSLYLDRIFNKGETLKMIINDGINSQDINKKEHTSELVETDLIVQYVTQMLNSPYPVYNSLKHSDRSTFYSYSLSGKTLLIEADNAEALVKKAIPVFKEYVKTEVKRLKLNEGKNIMNYNKKGSVIFSKRRNSKGEEVDVIKDFDKLVSADIKDFDKIWNEIKGDDQIKEVLSDDIKITKDFFEYYGVSEGNGIPMSLIHQRGNYDSVVAHFTINTLLSHIEETKLLIGDLKIFKNAVDAFKRFNVFSGTGEVSVTGSLTQRVITSYEKNDVIKINGRNFTYNVNENSDDLDMISEIVVSEQKYKADPKYIEHLEKNVKASYLNFYLRNGFNQKDAEDLASSKTEVVVGAYANDINEPDGQSYINLFELRRLMIRWGQWNDGLENSFQEELKILNGEEAYVDGKLYEAFVTLKPQYTGPFIDDLNYWDKNPEERINITGVAKTSYFPLLPSQVKGTKLETLNKHMIDKGVGVIHIASARKFGAKVDPTLESNHTDGLPNFYKEDGDINLDYNVGNLIQWMDAKYMKHQVKINNEEKGETIQSTQANKLNLANLFSNGIPIDYPDGANWNKLGEKAKLEASKIYKNVKRYIEIQNRRMEIAIGNLQERLAYDGTYSDYSKLVEVIKQSAEDRNSAKNIIEAIELFEQTQRKLLDALPNSNRIEPIIFSLISNSTINVYRKGNVVPQVSVQGWESNNRKIDEKGKIYASDELKSYIDENGNITEAEIIMPLPTEWIEPLQWIYREELNGSTSLMDLIDLVNSKPERIDDRLRIVKGLRIPNQQTSSNDIFRVKKFLLPTNIAMVVVPTVITVKVGADFDIDKLNMYFGHWAINEKTSKLEFLDQSNFKYKAKSVEKREEIEDSLLQNELLLLEKDILLDPNNFHNLMAPTIDDLLKDEVSGAKSLALKYGDNKVWDGKATGWGLITGYTNISKTREFIGSKGGVGQVAVHITGNTISQLYNVKISSEFIGRDGKKHSFEITLTDKQSNLVSAILNDEGEFISEILSALLTSQVDAVKDPYAKALNITNQTLNLVNYLLRRGVDHMTITKFLLQPIIKDYLRYQAIYESVTHETLGTALKFMKMFKLKKTREVPIHLAELRYPDITDDYAIALARSTNEETPEVLAIPDLKSKLDDALVNKNMKYQREMLYEYLRLIEHSKLFQMFTRATSPDTKKFKTLNGIINHISEMISLGNSGFIENLQDFYIAFDNYNQGFAPSEGLLKGFYNAQLNYFNMFKEFFLSQEDDFRTYFDNLKTELMNTKRRSPEGKVKSLKTLESDFIVYLLQNYTKDFNDNSYTSLMSGDNSIPKRILELQKQKRYAVLESLFPEISAENIFNTDIDSMKVLGASDTYTIDQYLDELNEIKEQDEKLYKDLILFSIYQSGIGNSPYSLEAILPSKYRFDLMQEAYSTFTNLPKQQKERALTEFKVKFALNNKNELATNPKYIISRQEKNVPILPFINEYNRDTKKSRIYNIKDKNRTRYTPLGGLRHKIYNRQAEVLNTMIEKIYNEEFDDTYEVEPKVANDKTLFQVSYKGGFENKGKGTPQGDGKDKAMRQIAKFFIGEMTNGNTESSTFGSLMSIKKDPLSIVIKSDKGGIYSIYDAQDGKVDADKYVSINNVLESPNRKGIVMLAKNGSAPKQLLQYTKDLILEYHKGGSEFVVGDMPGVDSQFIDYLQEIGAKFTIYHTGNTSRIVIDDKTNNNTPDTKGINETTKPC